MYLLDSNAVISLLNKRDSLLARAVKLRKPAEIAVSAIVMHELFYGAFKSKRAIQNVVLVDSLQFEVLDFNLEDARHAGEIRALLATQGTPIGPYDILIAGQALSRGLTLVTHNVSEFKRVRNLLVEDWEVAK